MDNQALSDSLYSFFRSRASIRPAQWGEIIERYTVNPVAKNTPRHYHNWDHILTGFARIFEFVRATDSSLTDELFWAWLFHDYAYATDGSIPDNEMLSADWAETKLRGFGITDGNRLNNVRNLIMYTKHNQTKEWRDAQVIMDVDLAGFGNPQIGEVYRGSWAIRQEFAHIPDTIYRPARKKILESFYNRPYLYQTDYFRQNYESTAKWNLQLLIDELV